MCRIAEDQVFPADVILIRSSSAEQTIVDTSCLDEDKSWQQKEVVNIGVDVAAPNAVQLAGAGVFQVFAPTGDIEAR